MSKLIDLVGQRYGQLTVLSYQGDRSWQVRCDCGAVKTVLGKSLRNGLTRSCGCATAELRAPGLKCPRGSRSDLTGQVFGQLRVLRRAPTLVLGPRRSWGMWVVLCACGTEKTVKRTALTHGLKTCGCGQSSPLAEGVAQRNRTLARYKQQAVQRGFLWGLTDEQALDLFGGNCHYCGIAPTAVSKGRVGDFIYNGIDRVDSIQGYTPENTVSCCGMCNRCKSNLSYEEFTSYLRRVGGRWFGLSGPLVEDVCP